MPQTQKPESPKLMHDRLNDRMSELGVMPVDLARFVGVSISAVLQWMSGSTKNLKLEYLFKVADALGLEARWLAIGEGPKEVSKTSVRREPLRRIGIGTQTVKNQTTKRQSSR